MRPAAKSWTEPRPGRAIVAAGNWGKGDDRTGGGGRAADAGGAGGGDGKSDGVRPRGPERRRDARSRSARTPVNHGSGGTIALSATADSGSHVYQGMTLDFVVDDEIDYDSPAVGGSITGPDAVTLTGWHYNPDTGTEDLAGTAVTGQGSGDVFLAVGTDMDPVRVTRWQFASTSAFTLDNLTVGLVNTPGGMPEQTAWVLLVVGFGVVGGAMRGRRRPSSKSGRDASRRLSGDARTRPAQGRPRPCPLRRSAAIRPPARPAPRLRRSLRSRRSRRAGRRCGWSWRRWRREGWIGFATAADRIFRFAIVFT